MIRYAALEAGKSAFRCTMSTCVERVRFLVTRIWSSTCEFPSYVYVYCSLSGSVSIRLSNSLPFKMFAVSVNWKSFKSPRTTTLASGLADTTLFTNLFTTAQSDGARFAGENRRLGIAEWSLISGFRVKMIRNDDHFSPWNSNCATRGLRDA